MPELKFPKINSMVLSCRLTKDVELKFLTSGKAVAKISVAFDRSYQKDGEWINETSYLDVISWNKAAEKCAEELHKGSPILVEGYLKIKPYEDKNGNKGKNVELVSNRIHFLEKGEYVNE